MSRELYNSFTTCEVVCDNIRMTNSENDSFVATFGFSDRCGLYGGILQSIQDEDGVKGCIMDPLCSKVYCDPIVVAGGTHVKVPGTEGTTVSPHTLSEICESHPVFTAMVSVTFKDVSIRLNESMGNGIYTVSYKSLEAKIISTPHAWSYDPVKRYGALGVSQIDVDKLTKFELVRDSM